MSAESASTSPPMTASTADSKRATGEPGSTRRFHVRFERRPVRVVVPPRDSEACIVFVERRRANVVRRQPLRKPGRRLVEKPRVAAMEEVERPGLAGAPAREERLRLGGVRLR